ncbi:DUF2268 domain-containing protein [Halobacillus sp. Nhm2S1]|uniref:DUF2268 domain-containing protein n=1 Tax=Halobacillus sp. Nhm2S1 TaxID=2866716 RepID=UPI001C73BCFD|nr:DUF2268 domain-containing putative Zn-dependent protease [Halobacillus sp. Nhm2S1]MBX0356946.1 DUF2268 domain-containing protein [Halobacillus sp. Nhm2S1]
MNSVTTTRRIMTWLVVWLGVLAGCSVEEKAYVEEDPKFFSYKDQDFEIITYEEEYGNYLGAMDTDDLKDIYHSTVLESFRTQAFGENEGYSLVSEEDWHFIPPENKSSLEKTLVYLEKEEAMILETIQKAIQDSVDLLPGGDKDIHVFPTNPDNTFGMGRVDDLSGVTWNEEFMLITIGRNFSEVALKQLIAHEYHHTVYNERNEPRYTLRENTVVEGKAEFFAKQVYPEGESSFTEPLRGRYKSETVDLFLEYADSEDPRIIADFFYGYPEQDIAPRAVYRIGYQIMKKFMEKHPDMPVEEWTNLSSETVVEGSGMDG